MRLAERKVDETLYERFFVLHQDTWEISQIYKMTEAEVYNRLFGMSGVKNVRC